MFLCLNWFLFVELFFRELESELILEGVSSDCFDVGRQILLGSSRTDLSQSDLFLLCVLVFPSI